MLRLCTLSAAVILAYDVIAGLASRLLWVTYSSLLLPGAIVLIALGIYAGRGLAVEVLSSAVVASAFGAFGVWLGLGIAGARRNVL